MTPDELNKLLSAATELTDAEARELWARFRDTGDRTAFERLMAWLRDPLSRCLRFMVADAHLAEDIFQDVLVTLLRCQHSRTLPAADDPRAWVWKVATNAVHGWRRAKKRRENRETESPPSESRPDPGPDQLIDRECVREALDRLTDDERRLVSLLYFQGLSQKTAAEQLGCHPQTLRDRLGAALERMRGLLSAVGVVVGATCATDLSAALPVRAGLPADRLSPMLDEAWRSATTGWGTWAKAAVVTGAVLLTGGLAFGSWVVLRNEPQVEQPPPPPPKVETLPEKNRRLFEGLVRPRAELAIRKLAPNEGESVRIARVATYDTRLEVHVAVTRTGPPRSATNLRVVFDSRDNDLRVHADLFGTGKWQSITPERPLYFTLGKREWVFRFDGIDELLKALREVNWTDERMDAEHEARMATFRAAAEPFLGRWCEDGNPNKEFTVEFGPNGLKYTFHTKATGVRPPVELYAEQNKSLTAEGLGRIENGVWHDFPEPGRFSTRPPTKP